MKEKKAIWGTITFMIISIGVYAVLKGMEIQGNVAYATIIILPVLVYAILTDKISSFKAGNIEATFKELANTRISTGEDSIEELSQDNLKIIDKNSTSILPERVMHLKKKTDGKKIILTLKMGLTGYYTREGVARYIKDLFMFTQFRFIVLLDSDHKVVAFISKEKLTTLLGNENLGNEFIRMVNEGSIDELNIFPGIVLNTLEATARNIDALKHMDEYKLNELIVVDDEGKLRGIIEREDILSKLMIALAE